MALKVAVTLSGMCFYLTDRLTDRLFAHSTEQCPSVETDTCSASQEILHTFMELKFHYHVHKSLLLVTILNWFAVHTLPSDFFKAHFNIILPFFLHIFLLHEFLPCPVCAA
jgi:hypothetical protein